MPTYEYRCNECAHQFEEFQSIMAKSLRTCPECGKRTLERLIGTGAGIIFKGSGFYETDYRSDSYKKGAEAEKKSNADTKTDSADGASKKEKPEKKDTKQKPADASGSSGGAKKPCGPSCGCA